jgi:hypothetical protein
VDWSDCSCCWPQKPKIKKAIGWSIYNGEGTWEEVDPFWYLDIGGWPKGQFKSWEEALKGAYRYLRGERIYELS